MARMNSSDTQEDTMSTAELSSPSRKRFGPGKVSANTSKHKVSCGRPIGSSIH